MTGICWALMDTLSRMLEPDEREAVCGDLTESGETGARALCGVIGLVVRRQTELWKDWRPWLALVGIVIPLGMLLSLVSKHTADGSAIYIWLYANNWDWAFLGNAVFRHDFPRIGAGVFMSYVTLICWSWTSGFVLGSLSRGAAQVNGATFCLMLLFAELPDAPRYLGNSLFLHRARDFENNAAVFALMFYRVMFPLIVQAFLVVLPSLCGMREGLRLAKLPPLLLTIVWTAAIATLAAIAIQSWVWWRFPNAYTRPASWNGWQMRLLQLVVYWPIGLFIVNGSWRGLARRRTT